MEEHNCIKRDDVRELFVKDNQKAVILAEVTTGMKAIKQSNDEMKTDIKEIKNELKSFIGDARLTFATKIELEASEQRLKEADENQNKEIGWSKEKIFEIGFKVAMVSGMIYLLLGISGCTL